MAAPSELPARFGGSSCHYGNLIPDYSLFETHYVPASVQFSPGRPPLSALREEGEENGTQGQAMLPRWLGQSDEIQTLFQVLIVRT
jgi:hypothetical protein